MVHALRQETLKQILFPIDGLGPAGDGIILSNATGLRARLQDCRPKLNLVIVVGNVDDVIDAAVEDLHLGPRALVSRVRIAYEGSPLFPRLIHTSFSAVGVPDSVPIAGVAAEWHPCVGRPGGEELWVSADQDVGHHGAR